MSLESVDGSGGPERIPVRIMQDHEAVSLAVATALVALPSAATEAGDPDTPEPGSIEAIAAADTLLLTVPNQLGVEYNAHVLDNILTHVAPELGWR